MNLPTEYITFAAAAPAGEQPVWMTPLMLVGMFAFMYVLVIRPQRKRQKEHQALITSLSKGDEVVLTSGMLGKISKIEGDYVEVEAADNLKMKFQKASVHAVLPKGTIKAI